MKRFHLIFGIVILVVFALTGQYMHRYLNHLEGMPDGLRMMYRTRHIFILLAGLVNLALAAYVVPRPARWQRVLQWIGSSLIVLATLLFVAGFVYDSPRTDLSAPLSYRGVFAIAYGGVFHLISGIGARSKQRNNESASS